MLKKKRKLVKKWTPELLVLLSSAANSKVWRWARSLIGNSNQRSNGPGQRLLKAYDNYSVPQFLHCENKTLGRIQFPQKYIIQPRSQVYAQEGDKYESAQFGKFEPKKCNKNCLSHYPNYSVILLYIYLFINTI